MGEVIAWTVAFMGGDLLILILLLALAFKKDKEKAHESSAGQDG